MMTSMRPWAVHVLCAPAATVMLFSFSVAVAQEKAKTTPPQDDTLQEVVVTGSRIARPDLDRLEPTMVVDAQAFDTRGYLDVGQALSENPAFGVMPSSPANTQSTFGIAQSFVDLYGLGSQRTLTLVDGRRFVSSNTASLNTAASNSPVGGPGQQVDLNVIPTKLIDRVETISVGGAPIYGADAIAGTVNIILKKDFQGLDLDAQGGISDRGDAGNERVRALAGQNFADGRANVTVVAELTKTNGLVGTSRPVYAEDLGFLAPATPGKYQTVLTPAESVAGINFGGIPMVDDAVVYSPTGIGLPAPPNGTYGITNAAGQVLAWGKGSTLQPYNLGTPTGNPVFASGGDGERLSQVSNLLSPTERMNFDTLGHFKINDSVNLFTEGWFSETHATNLLAQPAYNTTLFGTAGTANGNFILNVNNPYLAPGDRTLIQNALNNYAAAVGPTGFIYPGWNANQFYVSRANIDLQGGEATATQVLARGVIGLNGDFSLADRNFNWEVAANYGSSSNESEQPAYVFQNLQNALNATTNAAGQIVCAGTPVNAPTSTASSKCAPLNIFGLGSPSLAAQQYITHLATAVSDNSQRDVTANIGGDVWKLPAGEIKASVGFENRRESARFSPDSFYSDTLGQLSATGIEGAYVTNELYGETLIPIFSPQQDIPGLHRVELEGAARRVDNSIAGNATTWTEGMRWEPVEDVQLRANRTKSIRAPAITELFLPAATSFQFANDPCDKNFVDQGTAPATRAANCKAAGINTATFTSNVVNATAKGTSSGNTDLQSEVADSRTIGIVFRPRWVPRLNISVDYIDIRLADAIETLTLQQLLYACYDSTSYPNNPSCSSFSRNAEGQITTFHAGYVNAGLLHFQGIQAGLDYTFDLPANVGKIETRASYLEERQLVSQIGSASPIQYAGQLGAPTSKGTVDATYLKGPVSWNVQAIFVGSANFNNLNTETSQNILTIHPWWLINSTVGYEVTKAITTRLIVDNVFNKQPPFPSIAGTGGNFADATTQYFSGIIGRTYLLSAAVRF
jgi:outer membrane receptor protein involved in Fe transport